LWTTLSRHMSRKSRADFVDPFNLTLLRNSQLRGDFGSRLGVDHGLACITKATGQVAKLLASPAHSTHGTAPFGEAEWRRAALTNSIGSKWRL